MIINAGTGQHRPAAKRAVRQIQRLDITQRLSAAQIPFGNHCLNDAGLVSVFARQEAGYGDIAADACQKNDALNVHERHVGGAPVFVVLYYLGSRFSSGACRLISLGSVAGQSSITSTAAEMCCPVNRLDGLTLRRLVVGLLKNSKAGKLGR